MKYLLALLLLVSTFAQAETYAVKNPVPSQGTLTRQEVTWLYTMKTRFWTDGTKVTVYYLDRSSKVHKDFCKEVLNIRPEKFDSLLDLYLNSGNAGSFRMAKTQNDVLDKVSLLDGSIGYLDKDTLLINGGGHVAKIRITD